MIFAKQQSPPENDFSGKEQRNWKKRTSQGKRKQREKKII